MSMVLTARSTRYQELSCNKRFCSFEDELDLMLLPYIAPMPVSKKRILIPDPILLDAS